MSLRVVMVSASFFPHVGGAENQALELSLELKRRGLQARVLTRRLGDLQSHEEIRGISVERLNCLGVGAINSLTFMVSLAWRLWVEAGSYDVIHVHLASSPALAAILIGKLRGKKVVIKIGGGQGIGELALSSRSLLGRLKLLLFRMAQPTFVAVSQGIRQEAKTYLGEVPLHEIPNGVDTERFRPATAQLRRESRLVLGWPEGIGFLYTGRIDGVKRLPWFLEIWAEAVLKSKVPAFLAFVGEGVELGRIEEARRRLALENSVFIRPPISAIEKAYAAADVFVLPSASEGLSNSLLEAMSSGLAVLASQVGGSAEAVEDGRSGFLFKPNDEEDLKLQLGKILSHPDLSRKLGEGARLRAVERYSMPQVARQYEVLYGL